MGYHFLLQWIFPTQGSNPCLLCLLNWHVDSLPLNHLGSPPSVPKHYLFPLQPGHSSTSRRHLHLLLIQALLADYWEITEMILSSSTCSWVFALMLLLAQLSESSQGATSGRSQEAQWLEHRGSSRNTEAQSWLLFNLVVALGKNLIF